MQRITQFLICFLVTASVAEASIMIPLSKKYPIKSHNNIRVKIFPHSKNYRPHGKDQNKKSVMLSSTGLCDIYLGESYRTGKTSSLLKKNQKYINITAKDLRDSPWWIQCSGETRVTRETNRPDFVYAGNFYARVDHKGNVNLINIVDLEKYLKGVVPSEVYSGWPMETLKTQAVAARTYAVYHLARSRRMRRSFWDVDDTITYQAYTGTSLSNKRTNKSVQSTKGQIMTYDGKIIQAYYHANSGGITEQAKNVWMLNVPYVNVVQTQGQSEEKEWTVRLSLKKLERKLRYFRDSETKRSFMSRSENIEEVLIPAKARTNSDRVKFVQVKVVNFRDSATRIIEVPIDIFKRSSQRISSAKFRIEKDPLSSKYVNIVGSGDGHGVGMSQNGAMILAKKGHKYDEILNHYYNASLCNINKRTRACYK